MNETRTEYMQSEIAAIEAEGETIFDTGSLSNEYYAMLESYIKTGGTITQEQYNDLTDGQKFHFNKHHNFRGDKITA